MPRFGRCFLLLILMLPIRLGAEAPRYQVEVSVLGVTGASVSLTRGMRVHALFFRKGSDGDSPATRELLLVLHNVEVESSSPPVYPEGGNRKVASLLLSQGEAQAVRALPAAAVQLVVTSIPGGSRKLPHSPGVAVAPPTASRSGNTDSPGVAVAPPAASRHGHTDHVQMYVPPVSQARADGRDYVWLDSSRRVLDSIPRYLVWTAVGFLVLKTFAGTIRGARRCRWSGIERRRTALRD